MRVVVIEPPALLVTLAEVKAYLGVAAEDHDATLERHRRAACRNVDGPTGILGESIGVQTLELRLPAFPRGADCDGVRLPYGPVIDIVSVTYLDGEGVDQVVAEAGFALVSGPTIQPVYGEAWPAARDTPDSVRIRYRAGYVADVGADPLAPTPPDNIIDAVLLHIEILFDRPEAAALASLEQTRADLLATNRVWSV